MEYNCILSILFLFLRKKKKKKRLDLKFLYPIISSPSYVLENPQHFSRLDNSNKRNLLKKEKKYKKNMKFKQYEASFFSMNCIVF